MESILTSVKQMLGITHAYAAFDTELIIHINSVLAQLAQICPSVPASFSIENDSTTWNEYLADQGKIEFVKTYVYLKVRMIFDPPTGTVLDAMKETIREMEWRLSISDTDEGH